MSTPFSGGFGARCSPGSQLTNNRAIPFFINGQRYDGPHDPVSIIAAIRTALELTPPPGRVHRR